MGLGIAKIDKETIPQELGNMSFIALDDLGTERLVCTDHVTPVFRVELPERVGGIHQIAEHDRELPSFRVGRRRVQ